MTGLPCSICSYITYIHKQPNALTLRSFIKILDYRTQLHVFGVEGINKEPSDDAMFIH